MRRLFVGILVAGLLTGAAGLAAWGWLEWKVHEPGASVAEDVEFTVPRGATGREIGILLEKEGVISDRRVWRYHLWRRGGLDAKAGRFLLSPAGSIAQIAKRLE